MENKLRCLRFGIMALMAVWMAGLAIADCPTADLTGDCKVDLEDVSILSQQWLLSYNTEDLTLISAQWQDALEYPAGMEFVTIPAGTFQMGGDNLIEYTSSQPIHTVTLSSFKMSKYEITNAQYVQFLNAAQAQGKIKEVKGVIFAFDASTYQPWCSTAAATEVMDNGYYSQIINVGGIYCVRTRDGQPQDNHPVVCVSWYGARAFCDFYGLHLPTEAQWEYAARGGHMGWRFPWGEFITQANANYTSRWTDGRPRYSFDINSTSGSHPTYTTGTMPYTAPVGSFPDNDYGIYDVIGNVWEWCADWCDYDYYSVSPISNPAGPDSGIIRVTRGGGWGGNNTGCQVAARRGYPPDMRSSNFGFRVCQ